MLDQDLNVFYFGASGGFYFLHYLLLYKKHHAHFPIDPALRQAFLSTNSDQEQLRLDPESYANCQDPTWPDYDSYCKNFVHLAPDLKQELSTLHWQHAGNLIQLPGWSDYQLKSIVDHQWAINDQSWKSLEQWPDNQCTLYDNPVDRKHKLYFTCNYIDQWLALPGKKIVLYTDIRSQIRLALYKHAWWFQDLAQASTRIKSMLRSAVEFRGDQCYENLAQAFALSDQQIKLQDFVQDPASIVCAESTIAQLDLKRRWLANHSNNLLNACGLA